MEMIDRRRLTWRAALIFLLLVSIGGPIGAQSPSPADIDAALRRAGEVISVQPRLEAEYDYIMTARVRLLLFWVGKDDVGGGYIRRGTLPGESQSEVIQLLMGSDPAKAPRAINRWGAATEIVHGSSESNQAVNANTFLGFMKVSKGTSVSEMQKELAREKQGGEFQFSAIINQASSQGRVARVVPFSRSQG